MDNSADHLKELRQTVLADDTEKKLEEALAKLSLPLGGSL
jgi:hypothetical protein